MKQNNHNLGQICEALGHKICQLVHRAYNEVSEIDLEKNQLKAYKLGRNFLLRMFASMDFKQLEQKYSRKPTLFSLQCNLIIRWLDTHSDLIEMLLKILPEHVWLFPQQRYENFLQIRE